MSTYSDLMANCFNNTYYKLLPGKIKQYTAFKMARILDEKRI